MQNDFKKALEDVDEIKRVLNLTFEDFSSAAKLFFTTGLFWVIEGILNIFNILTFAIWPFKSGDMSIGMQVTIHSLISRGISIVRFIAVLCVYLVCRAEQKRHARGLGIQLIDMWGFLLLGITLYASAANSLYLFFLMDKTIANNTLSISYVFLMAVMPLMLMATGILTGRTQPKISAIIYIVISLVLLVVSVPIEYSTDSGVSITVPLGQMLSTTIIPGLFTLLMGANLYRPRSRA